MEWKQIVGFYHVARLGSFTRAAGVIFKTQSALTQQIKALEGELGFPLFERIGKRKLRLTSAGEKFFAFAEAILSKYDSLMEELAELKGLPIGRLRIAAPFTTLYHLFPEVLKEYVKQFPQVELTVLDRSQQNVIELVKNGEVDFGLALESAVPKELTKIRWKKVEAVLLAPAGHPLAGINRVTLKQIARYPLILPPKTSEYTGRIKLEELFRELGINYRIIMESSNVELSSLYVETGLGISFATIVKGMPALKQRNLEYISLGHILEPGYIAVVMRKDKVLSAFKSAFINTLLDSF
ncbi:LysR family transcriptional regulator [Desulfotomaculum copahuensis]|uniref:LysR family transcriptional regulator n=1 Tax=Desulfotomaculum copahuensis TaxID=1838280 RepID=A0A1B7LAQ2_9FIRM|nr:LysR family transcriptional regulator [Desulfotomaculum copahuensis]OAT79281.1 LysR family transcriptional regulator [Desulfotomaculum copahuensis]